MTTQDKFVLCPVTGEPVTLADLPCAARGSRVHWVIRQKAVVIAAINGGLITLEDARERCSLSHEEFQTWLRLVDEHGLPGLRVTKAQHYRSLEPAE